MLSFDICSSSVLGRSKFQVFLVAFIIGKLWFLWFSKSNVRGLHKQKDCNYLFNSVAAKCTLYFAGPHKGK